MTVINLTNSELRNISENAIASTFADNCLTFLKSGTDSSTNVRSKFGAMLITWAIFAAAEKETRKCLNYLYPELPKTLEDFKKELDKVIRNPAITRINKMLMLTFLDITKERGAELFFNPENAAIASREIVEIASKIDSRTISISVDDIEKTFSILASKLPL